jgi:PPOX class probable F420-dependent enzyme
MEVNDRARRRLSKETIGWLTTVSPDGRPQSAPVWFLFDGEDEIVVFSLAGTPRERNLASNAHVSFHLDGDGHGGNVLTIEGRAAIDLNGPRADAVPAYVEKYQGYMNVNGWTPAWFAGHYPIRVAITLTRLKSF